MIKFMKLIKAMLPFAMAALCLTACGGAVEGGSTIEDDTTAPNFIKGDPKGSTTEVCSITAEFDDEIEASTVTDQSFIIQGSTATDPLSSGDGTWGLSPSSNTIALFVPSSIPLDGSYTVTITTAITNTAGINLAGNQSWTFTTILPCPP